MLKVYFLRRLKNIDDNSEYVEGQAFISHAIIEATVDPKIVRAVIEGSPKLDILALRTDTPSSLDNDKYNSLPKPTALPSPRNALNELDAIKQAIKDATSLADLKARIV